MTSIVPGGQEWQSQTVSQRQVAGIRALREIRRGWSERNGLSHLICEGTHRRWQGEWTAGWERRASYTHSHGRTVPPSRPLHRLGEGWESSKSRGQNDTEAAKAVSSVRQCPARAAVGFPSGKSRLNLKGCFAPDLTRLTFGQHRGSASLRQQRPILTCLQEDQAELSQETREPVLFNSPRCARLRYDPTWHCAGVCVPSPCLLPFLPDIS